MHLTGRTRSAARSEKAKKRGGNGMADPEKARRRYWTNLIVMIVGVFQFGIAFWGAGLAQPHGMAYDMRLIGWYWFASGFGGLLAVASVIVAIRNATLGRVMLALGALLVLSGGFAYTRFEPRMLLDVFVPGLILLGAVPFFGPMPTPEEEGKER